MIDRISTYIADLLYDNEIVIIPNLGGFMTSYKSSGIDYVQGLISPPSKHIVFNPNLVVNDGLLLNYIRDCEHSSQTEARNLLDEYVVCIKDALAAREIVVFPDVGRLYLDYEHNMQFLPDSINYNTEVYALPTVQYYPILRSRESAEKDAKQPLAVSVAAEKALPIPAPKSNWKALLRPAVPYILAGVIVLGGIGIYSSIDTKSIGTGAQYMPINLPNLNQSPSKNQPVVVDEIQIDEDVVDQQDDFASEDDAAQVTKNTELSDVLTETELKEEKVATVREQVLDTEGATLGPNDKMALITVHCFGDKRNVRKMMDNLIAKGYEPFQEPYKGLTRVGVKVIYRASEKGTSKLKRELNKIQKKFNKGAYILTDDFK